jgi:hypothetical protein
MFQIIKIVKIMKIVKIIEKIKIVKVIEINTGINVKSITLYKKQNLEI